ncbi:MAG: hypothetical protein K8U57_39425 [Planctomycetes bacterium]|nr:hypothetical protein [Planctomycetota bacterium]
MNTPNELVPSDVSPHWRRWRGRDWFLAAIPVLLAFGVAYLHFSSPPPAISLDTYKQITLGMTQTDVEQVVLARPGGYGAFWGPGETLREGEVEPAWWVRWGSGYGLLYVGFGTDGRVCAKRLEYHLHATPSHPEKWSVWRRLVERSVPEREPWAIYDPF